MSSKRFELVYQYIAKRTDLTDHELAVMVNLKFDLNLSDAGAEDIVKTTRRSIAE